MPFEKVTIAYESQASPDVLTADQALVLVGF